MGPTLVDPAVTRKKLQHDFELWNSNPHRKERGWLLLSYDEEKLSVELAFLAKLATSVGSGFLPIIACAVRLEYDNYDLMPPSLTFIDAFSREPIKPHVAAVMSSPEGPRNVLIDSHPLTGLPFLCLAGVREYHTHPQHTGDDWLLHRSAHEGSLSNISERIWRLMAKNIVGLQVVIQALPVWPLQAQLQLVIAQGEVESISAPSPSAVPAEVNSEALNRVA